MSGNQYSRLQRILQSKLTLSVLIGVTALSAIRLAHEIFKRTTANEKIGAMKQEIEKLKTEQESLSSLIGFLMSDTYIESEARNKLNLAKPGETTVIIKDPAATATSPEHNRRSNIEEWWLYFFNGK